MSAEPTLSERLARVSRELARVDDVHVTLQRVVELAVETIEGCEHAGVSLVVGDGVECPAQTDPIPALIDRMQVELGEGPHRDALREQEVFATGDLGDESRWSRFSTEVVRRTGVRSMLAVRLFAEQDTLGSLNLYATAVDAFGDADRSVASIFAAHAAVALRTAQQHQQLRETIEGDDVDVIGMAKGILMADQHIDEEEAAVQLQDEADHLHRDVREVAEQIVEDEQRG